MFRAFIAAQAVAVLMASLTFGQTKPDTSGYVAAIDRAIEKMKVIAVAAPPPKATSAAMKEFVAQQALQLNEEANFITGGEQVYSLRIHDVLDERNSTGGYRINGVIVRPGEVQLNNAERKFLQEWNAEQRKREADLNQQKPKTPADRQALDEQRQRLVARRGDGADLARKYAEYRQPSATITLYTDNAELKNVPRQSTLRVRSTIESCTHQVHFRTPNLGRAANIAMNYVGSERGLAEFQRSGAKLGENELVVIKFSLKGTLVEVLPEEQTTKASSTK